MRLGLYAVPKSAMFKNCELEHGQTCKRTVSFWTGMEEKTCDFMFFHALSIHWKESSKLIGIF